MNYGNLYGSSGYVQPPQPYMQQAMPYVQQPQPQPQVQWDFNDPNVFRPYFRSGLQALTSNSRQIIQDLTGMASEFAMRMAGVVAEELEQHIRNCHPAIKLPALYLMDSIAKNVGQPYVTLFTRFIERLFLQVYREVDPVVKVKMEELLGTWRTGGPDGGQLYGGNNGRVQHTLEEALFGRGGKGGGIGGGGRGMLDNAHYVMAAQQRPSLAPPQESAALSTEIKRVITSRQAQLYRNPSDMANQIAIDALQKLDALVTSDGVTSEQVHQIRQQLTALMVNDSPPASIQPLPTHSQPSNEYYSNPQLAENSLLDQLSQIDPATLSSLLAAQPIASTSKSTLDDDLIYDQAMSGIDLNNVSEALQNLDPNLLATLVSASGVDAKEQTAKELEYEKKLFKGFDKENGKYGLSTIEIVKAKPDSFQLLYDELPLQCTQCSARWLDTPRHRKILQQHLDRHFRINNRLAAATRAQSRSWFVLSDDWIAPDEEIQITEEQENVLDLAEIAKSRVVAPTDPSKAGKPCPICKEPFKSEWDDANEEWVWLDAIKVDKTIYHATCYTEMKRSRALARVIKEEHDYPTPEDEGRMGSPTSDSEPLVPRLPVATDVEGSTEAAEAKTDATHDSLAADEESDNIQAVESAAQEDMSALPVEPDQMRNSNEEDDPETDDGEEQERQPLSDPEEPPPKLPSINIKQEPQDAISSLDMPQALPVLDSNLLNSLADIIRRSSTPEVNGEGQRKRRAEDEVEGDGMDTPSKRIKEE